MDGNHRALLQPLSHEIYGAMKLRQSSEKVKSQLCVAHDTAQQRIKSKVRGNNVVQPSFSANSDIHSNVVRFGV